VKITNFSWKPNLSLDGSVGSSTCVGLVSAGFVAADLFFVCFASVLYGSAGLAVIFFAAAFWVFKSFSRLLSHSFCSTKAFL